MSKNVIDKIGIIDADLLDGGTRHPNLALMKISGYYKELGCEVELLHSYDNIGKYDKVFLSCVFSFTNIPINIEEYDNLIVGGSGLFWKESPRLPEEIEHHMPDYHLYDTWIEKEADRGVDVKKYKDYKDYSIGFTTRGCIRKCKFCINQDETRVVKHSPVSEFLDESRKYIYLLDDNILAYPKWKEVLQELKDTNKPFQFRQGMDIRLLTEEKAEFLSTCKYHGDYIFAFDDIEDKDIITKKLILWKKYVKKTTKLYVFCGFDRNDKYDEDFWKQDIIDTFERIKILMKLGCNPYIMRHENYEKSPYRGIYITLARWCNQPSFYKKMSLVEYCRDAKSNGVNSASYRYINEFKEKYPCIADKYYNMKYEELREM